MRGGIGFPVPLFFFFEKIKKNLAFCKFVAIVGHERRGNRFIKAALPFQLYDFFVQLLFEFLGENTFGFLKNGFHTARESICTVFVFPIV